MFGSYILVSITMWMVARFSPLEWKELELCDKCLLESYCDDVQYEEYSCSCSSEMSCELSNQQAICNTIISPEPPLEYKNADITILEVLQNDFTIGNSFWFGVGTLMQQGSGLNPKVQCFRPALYHRCICLLSLLVMTVGLRYCIYINYSLIL